jgi:hypothetical protein
MREVPREQWAEVLDAVSRSHRGWLVTLEVGTEVDARAEARTLPFAGAELRRGGEAERFVVHLGEEPRSDGGRLAPEPGQVRLRHELARPAHVRLEEDARGSLRGIELLSEGGDALWIRFRSPMLPEMVDGM